MKRESQRSSCPECRDDVTRRNFLATAAGTTLAAGTLPLIAPALASAAPTRDSAAESSARELFESLSDEQKQMIALPLDDKRRTRISANWHITDTKIAKFFDNKQQELVDKVVRGVTSEDGYGRLIQQMKDDDNGIGAYSVAFFGSPDDKQFEFELTGRHLTLRADGNSLDRVAFGGPIVYGHGATGNSRRNLFFYQTQQANEVFKALSEEQRSKALLPKAPAESQVQLRGKGAKLPGISGGDLSDDQKELLNKSLQAIMKIYRQEDVDEVMQIIKATGGTEALHMAFYENKDLDGDKVWDVWRIEGPGLVCHFRGDPHVHAYINIAQPA